MRVAHNPPPVQEGTGGKKALLSRVFEGGESGPFPFAHKYPESALAASALLPSTWETEAG